MREIIINREMVRKGPLNPAQMISHKVLYPTFVSNLYVKLLEQEHSPN